MNLSSRLVLAFAFIILVTLLLSCFTLLLVSRPIQDRLNRIQLANQSRLTARRIETFLEQGGSIEEINERINRSPVSNDSRFLLVDRQSRILADSQATWVGRSVALDSGRQARIGDGRTGALQTPDGQTANFAAHPISDGNAAVAFIVTLESAPAAVPNFFSQIGLGYITAGIISLLVSLLIGVLIARSIALPLRHLSRATAAVAAGDYTHRVPESGPPEIKRLSASFNTMAGQVEAGQTAMRDFVSNVSHELKTPLTSIKGFSQALMEGATQDEAARRRAAEIIYEEAARMGRLVEDLLDLARIDSGQMVLHKTPLDLPLILNSTVDRLLPQAVKKEIELVRKWADLPPVIGDGDRLAQLFTNLLDNAVRHTPQGGSVTIKARVASHLSLPRQNVARQPSGTSPEPASMLQVAISDTGPGIPPDELARIFERFYQTDKSRKRGSGAGLGLAIIKEIIEAHGGTIAVESEIGGGTTFVVALPLAETESRTALPQA